LIVILNIFHQNLLNNKNFELIEFTKESDIFSLGILFNEIIIERPPCKYIDYENYDYNNYKKYNLHKFPKV